MRRGRALIVLAAAAFGALAFFAKVALREGVAPLTFVLGRFVVATTVLAAVTAVGAPRRPSRKLLGRTLALGALLYGGQAVGFAFALDHGDASTVAILFGTYPAMVVAGVAATRGRAQIGRHHVAALVGVLVGAGLVVGPDAANAAEPIGVILALVSAACFGGFVLAADTLRPAIDGRVLATVACAGAALSTSWAVALTGGIDTHADDTGWLAVVAAGLISTAVAFLALFSALPRIGPAIAGITLGAEPVVTVALSVAFLGDRLGVLQGAGAALVIGAVMALAARAPRSTPPVSA